MTREFVIAKEFDKNWKSMGLSDNDLKTLQEELILTPQKGDVIQGTGGLRKIRISFDNRGKSSSGRVCYVDFAVYDKIYLIAAYQKNVKENLSKAERNEIAKIIEKIELELERKG